MATKRIFENISSQSKHLIDLSNKISALEEKIDDTNISALKGAIRALSIYESSKSPSNEILNVHLQKLMQVSEVNINGNFGSMRKRDFRSISRAVLSSYYYHLGYEEDVVVNEIIRAATDQPNYFSNFIPPDALNELHKLAWKNSSCFAIGNTETYIGSQLINDLDEGSEIISDLIYRSQNGSGYNTKDLHRSNWREITNRDYCYDGATISIYSLTKKNRIGFWDVYLYDKNRIIKCHVKQNSENDMPDIDQVRFELDPGNYRVELYYNNISKHEAKNFTLKSGGQLILDIKIILPSKTYGFISTTHELHFRGGFKSDRSYSKSTSDDSCYFIESEEIVEYPYTNPSQI